MKVRQNKRKRDEKEKRNTQESRIKGEVTEKERV